MEKRGVTVHKNAVLCDARILDEIKKGHILISPYNEEQLNNCSYNVKLSEYFFREIQTEDEVYLNPWNEKHVAQRWELGEPEISDGEHDLEVGTKYISLAPLETILVATKEFIGARRHLTAMIEGRSSAGRSFLSICSGGGWLDCGCIGRVTLMITNLSRYATTILPIGCSVAQVIFLECGAPRKTYSGKYTLVKDTGQKPEEFFAELEKNWTPEAILPQAYKENPKSEEEEKAEFEVENVNL